VSDAREAELESLRLRLSETEAALHALSCGEIDAVATAGGATPLLLVAAQTKLLESESLLRAIFQGASDAILLFDDVGRILDANVAACELCGRTRESLVGGTVGIIDWDAAWKQLLALGHLRAEMRLARPDGDVRGVDLSATSHIVPGRHLAIIRDVTERMRASEERSHLAAIVESSDEAIISADTAGLITSWNRSAEHLFQWSAAEAIGKPLTLLVPPERLAETLPRLERVKRGEVVRNIETKHVRKDGSVVETLVTSSPIFDARRQVVGTARVVRDLTERRRTEAQLRQVEAQLQQSRKMEAIGVVAGGVAHDFNNILSVILSCASMVLDEPLPEQVRSDVIEIARAGERAADLTRQLLAFSRRQVLEPRVLDLGLAVLAMDKMLRRLLGAEIELSLVTGSASCRTRADPSQIDQIIMNLAVNAKDAMPGGGKLIIEVAPVEFDAEYAASHGEVTPGFYVMLAVTDTGTGMDDATRARIFEPFFTTKEVGKGTGLGLSTVFGIVQQSRGHIWVYSELGRGTTFKVYFPCVEEPVEALSISPPPPTTLRGSETILLVDDDESVRATIRAVLQRNGYHVLDAAGPGEALLISDQQTSTIDLLLTDVAMPRMSGPDLASRLQQQRREIKVLYLSGYTENAVIRQGVLDGGLAFLQKPVVPGTLLRRVREVIDQSGRPRVSVHPDAASTT
jgi:PAS domain S-box-containing protein